MQVTVPQWPNCFCDNSWYCSQNVISQDCAS